MSDNSPGMDGPSGSSKHYNQKGHSFPPVEHEECILSVSGPNSIKKKNVQTPLCGATVLIKSLTSHVFLLMQSCT